MKEKTSKIPFNFLLLLIVIFFNSAVLAKVVNSVSKNSDQMVYENIVADSFSAKSLATISQDETISGSLSVSGKTTLQTAVVKKLLVNDMAIATGLKAMLSTRMETGATGSTGGQGPLGLPGARGSTGATGPIGVTGKVGSTGAQGPRGATGIVGSTGATGATGSTGITGATGARGITGSAGMAGARGAAGQQGATGQTGSAGVSITGSTGATGARGAFGVTGAPGATGKKGEMGIAGVAGAQGAKGSTGETGATGNRGTQGLKGAQGEKGAPGATGITEIIIGSTGAQGAVGSTGAQGATGSCVCDMRGESWVPEYITAVGFKILHSTGLFFKVDNVVVCALQIVGTIKGPQISIDFSLPSGTRTTNFLSNNDLMGTVSTYGQTNQETSASHGSIQSIAGTPLGKCSLEEVGMNSNRLTLSLNFIFTTV